MTIEIVFDAIGSNPTYKIVMDVRFFLNFFNPLSKSFKILTIEKDLCNKISLKFCNSWN